MKKVKGLTLIELIIVLMVSGVIALVMANVIYQTFLSKFRVQAFETVTTTGSNILFRLTSEIEEASQIFGVPFTYATMLTLSYDVNEDGFDEWCKYYLISDSLVLTTSTPSWPILTIGTGVSELSFAATTLLSSPSGAMVTVRFKVSDKRLEKVFQTSVVSRYGRN